MDELEQNYQDALDYIFSFVDYSLTRNFRFSPEKFDMARMVAFMDRLGNPHKSYPVIHVAGTKGKGSTSVVIASSLQAQGYRVGLYTSPHMQEFTERIQVSRQQISPADLVQLVNEVKPVVAQIERLTTFEIITAIGFLFFARQKVDVAVIEVGLGGRLDATNVVDPCVSVISSLSLDHVAVLGDTLAKIAFEKAGIIKPGRPVVIAPQAEEAREVLQAVAAERGCALTQVGQDYLYALQQHNLDGQTFKIWQKDAPVVTHTQLFIPLLGQHQVENAATAYAALQVARRQGIEVSDQAIVDGYRNVSWTGRFEILSRAPVVVVDSAHNRNSARRLSQTLQDYLPGRPVSLIFGASEDKDVSGMFAELFPMVRRVFFTQSRHPRAMDLNHLEEQAAAHGMASVQSLPIEEAMEQAVNIARSENGVVLVAGSLFIAAAALDIWKKNFSEH